MDIQFIHRYCHSVGHLLHSSNLWCAHSV